MKPKRRKRQKPARRLRRRRKWWLVLALPGFFALNWVIHVVRIPSQAAGPLEPYFYKTPQGTWEAHGDLFRAHATTVLTPTFLAALAQTEAGGNPIATTYWRWRWSWNPFHWYSPASSAAGLFQITDATFAEARRYCVHGGKVAQVGAWYDWNSCWFNSFYNRLSASHATEMTAAYLQHSVDEMTARVRSPIPLRIRQRLAAVLHLCGRSVAQLYVSGRFHLPKGQRCGDHSAAAYVKQVETYQRIFEKLAR